MSDHKIQRIKTITEYHRMRGLPPPEHPLISVINVDKIKQRPNEESQNFIFDFYIISLKRCLNSKFRYGQQEYDFDEGVMFFLAPNQVFGVTHNNNSKAAGYMLLVHPDFLWHSPLAGKIRQYEYFDYAVNEALFLSDKEEATIISIYQNIQQEYHSNIDKYSQDVIIAQLELLLTYSERFYQRQFITRKITNHSILNRFQNILNDYFDNDVSLNKGLPTVQYMAGALHVSPNYLSGLLKTLTGQSPIQHIHDKVIAKAKERLSTTELTVSEIAYELGFEHSQSFSKLFKSKTNFSPLEFRQSFN